MNEREYKITLEALNQTHNVNIESLRLRYAKDNNPHSIGDIVTDHKESIVIESMCVGLGGSNMIPVMVYTGTRVKKNGELYKSKETCEVWQSNLV